MKGNVLAQGKVQDVLKEFVFAELWTDRTQWADENNALLRKRFKTPALPLYATLGPDGQERSRLIGVATADQFVDFLKKGLSSPAGTPLSKATTEPPTSK
jgi:thiol:disulfide interchange protein